jgi:hypothetical protein
VEAILRSDTNPTEALARAFPEPQPKKPEIPVYYTLYRPKDAVVPKEELKFTALTEERRKEVLQDNFSRHKMGAWWWMRKLLKAEQAPYQSIPEDDELSRIYSEVYEEEDYYYEEKELAEAMGDTTPMQWYRERAEQGT